MKVPSNVLLMQDSFNDLINLNFIPREYLMQKIFGIVPSLEILDDDSGISVYAKESLGVGNPNMLLNITVVLLPLLLVIILAMLLLVCALRVKMP